jgi:hypothetical protein
MSSKIKKVKIAILQPAAFCSNSLINTPINLWLKVALCPAIGRHSGARALLRFLLTGYLAGRQTGKWWKIEKKRNHILRKKTGEDVGFVIYCLLRHKLSFIVTAWSFSIYVRSRCGDWRVFMMTAKVLSRCAPPRDQISSPCQLQRWRSRRLCSKGSFRRVGLSRRCVAFGGTWSAAAYSLNTSLPHLG